MFPKSRREHEVQLRRGLRLRADGEHHRQYALHVHSVDGVRLLPSRGVSTIQRERSVTSIMVAGGLCVRRIPKSFLVIAAMIWIALPMSASGNSPRTLTQEGLEQSARLEDGRRVIHLPPGDVHSSRDVAPFLGGRSRRGRRGNPSSSGKCLPWGEADHECRPKEREYRYHGAFPGDRSGSEPVSWGFPGHSPVRKRKEPGTEESDPSTSVPILRDRPGAQMPRRISRRMLHRQRGGWWVHHGPQPRRLP